DFFQSDSLSRESIDSCVSAIPSLISSALTFLTPRVIRFTQAWSSFIWRIILGCSRASLPITLLRAKMSSKDSSLLAASPSMSLWADVLTRENAAASSSALKVGQLRCYLSRSERSVAGRGHPVEVVAGAGCCWFWGLL